MEDDEYELGAPLDAEEAAIVNALTPEDISAIDEALLGATSSSWSKDLIV